MKIPHWMLAVLLALPIAASAAERPLLVAKSEVGFAIKQMGVTVSGVFKRYSAKIVLDPAQLEKASATFEVETASLDTGDGDTDTEARNQAWLDAAGFPRAQFVSSAVRALGKDRDEASGTLSIKGKSKPLTVPFTLSPQADGSATVTGEFVLKRVDYGIGGGEWNEGDLISPDVTVRFRLALGPAK